MTAGAKSRRKVNTALRQAAQDGGVELTFTELENWLIDRAVELEDWREVLQAGDSQTVGPESASFRTAVPVAPVMRGTAQLSARS